MYPSDRRRGAIAGGILVGWALLASGCGGDGSASKPREAQAQVAGAVTNDGKPITLDSVVSFYSKDKGVLATGKVDTLGNYSLVPNDSKVGIPAGRYYVSIRPPAVTAPSVGSEDYKKLMMQNKSVVATDAPTEIPLKFQTFDSSKIILEIKEGANKFDFDLAKLK